MSIRTLHHYDAMGLLVPSGRQPSGYLQRLRRILFYRELDFGPAPIREMLAGPATSICTHCAASTCIR